MEFKKSNRYSNGRARLTVPQRGDTPPFTSAPKPPVQPTPTAPLKQRTPQPAVAPAPAKRSSFRRSLKLSKKLLQRSGIVLAIIIVVIFIGFTIKNNSDPNTLRYQTISPNGASVSELGGWKRVSPPDDEPVFAYVDTIDNISITVSEQPLPKELKTNTSNQVAELAKKFNATATIDAGETKAYIGTSAKGPQSVIFAKDNLLILIKSQNEIDTKAWAKYIQSLK